MTYLIIWMLITMSISIYFAFKAMSYVKEEYWGKIMRVIMTPFPFEKKFYTEVGLKYRKRALLTGLIGFIGFITIVIIIVINNHK
jgi:hypothetical protein